jgi:signal transduction histidine kinase
MSIGSLRLRLLAGAAAFIVAALVLAALGLTFLFERHVERWIDGQMTSHLDQLIAGIERGPDGKLAVVKPPGDTRFQQPLSGFYWQVQIEPDGPELRSRSLWDFAIDLPPEARVDDEIHTYDVAGPDQQQLHLLQRRITLPERLGGQSARVAVAIDHSDMTAAVRNFAAALLPYLLVLAVLLTAAAWAQVTIGLRPLAAVRRQLAAIASGEVQRLGDDFPDEVQPLARQIDTLLEARDRQIDKARARAADLAHGLKTPLQVLSDDAERLRAKGDDDLAAEIEDIAGAMRRHVDRELARARTGAGRASTSANVATVAERVVRVVERTPHGKSLSWTTDVPKALTARIDPEDLTEALGTLAENAARHARSSVTIRARSEKDAVTVAVIDDGPGIPLERAQEALRRGGRLDSSGSAGLGLAIVGDIAEAWGATLTIETPERGCRISLQFPSTTTRAPA